jgi:hypothetical protein
MKLTNATWEERNSGLKTCEILFEKGDTIEDFRFFNFKDDFKYFVAKVSSENIKLVHYLEECGFRYIETQFNISVATEELEKIDKKWLKIIEGTDYIKMTRENDLADILSNVGAGLFENDRISLDDNLGKVVSALRYTNWIKDLFKDKKSELFYLTKQSKKVGFFVIQKHSKYTINSVIAGIFKPYQGQGLSVALIYYYLKLASVKGVKQSVTSFSSNNLSMLNTFTKVVSFKVLNVYYVLNKKLEN